MRKFTAALSATIVAALLAACGNPASRADLALDTEPLVLDNPPPLAAEYVTTVESRGDGKNHRDEYAGRDEQVWRVWRDDARVEVLQLDSNSGEAWLRSGASVSTNSGASQNEPLFFLRLFHTDRTTIEYTPAELGVLGMTNSWRRAQLLIDPAALQQLQAVARATWQGRRSVTYRGEIDGDRISIDWLVDDRLPARVQRHSGDTTTVITLHELHPLASAPWQRPPSADYRVIDYADLGDMERDPFVQRALSMIPGGEHHHHDH